MCGILTLAYRSAQGDLETRLRAGTAAVTHRGPDDEGYALFTRNAGELRLAQPGEAAHLGLGHRRLSILDLSVAGRQPMMRPAKQKGTAGKRWLIYNGEIYNYLELRRELEAEGYRFATGTDTEVILAAFDAWGPTCVERFHGMWALVLLDSAAGRLYLSRDRLGIKPLYLYPHAASPGTHAQRQALAICSEIKQLTFLPEPPSSPDEAAVAEYLLTGYEAIDRTFFAGVTPLPAGTWTTVDLETLEVAPPRSFWQPEAAQLGGEPRHWSRSDAAEAVAAELERAVSWQLRSDVPVGCALSGGLDSSAITATAARLRPAADPLHTFTAVFPDDPINEGPFAHQVAMHVGAREHPVEPTAEGFLEDLETFVWHHDEPVGSLAMYAAFRVARQMRAAGVPVVLNGQGGDEVLGGYWQSYLAYLVGRLRRGDAFTPAWHLLGSLVGGNPTLLGELPMLWRRFRERRTPPLTLAPHLQEAAASGAARVGELLALSESERRVREMREFYLPRLLKWDDRNLMAFSVEGRYPFLDHTLIELCLSFSPSLLYRRGWTKEPLRRALALGNEDKADKAGKADKVGGTLPRSILRRRDKRGFETPQDRWLRGPLAPAWRSLLEEADAPVWEWADRASARALAELPARSGDRVTQVFFRLWMLDRWLRRFF